MKNILKSASLILASAAIFTACNKPDDAPKPVEQELITTMKLIVTGSDGFNKTFTYKVENGFGNTTAGSVVKDSIILAANKTYDVEVQLLNEKEEPAENITEEVVAESEEHLFLFQSTPASGAGSITTADGSKDAAGNPLNQKIKFVTGSTGAGALTVTLKHEPTNKNAATPDAAGGETDVEAAYDVTIQ